LSFSAMLACAVCKAAHRFLRLINKGGTALPGRLALMLCPSLIGQLAHGLTVIAVSGTNGKTTACRMLASALKHSGRRVFSNGEGANLRQGIAAALAGNTDAFGRPKCDHAVIECDEGAAASVFPELKPRVIVLTNLFRDQEDRFGTPMETRARLVAAIRKTPDSVLCLNADCALTATVGGECGSRALFFGSEHGRYAEPREPERLACPVCGGRLAYSRLSYSHLGVWSCLGCGLGRPSPEVCITDVFDNGISVSIGGVRRICPMEKCTEHNAYNAAAAMCAAAALGIDTASAVAAVGEFSAGFGRMEEFALGGGATMLLTKNAAAMSRAFDTAAKTTGSKTLVLIQNARAGDGRDLSWLDGADFGKLSHMRGLRRIIVSGEAREAVGERLKKAGLDFESVSDYDELTDILSEEKGRIFLLPSYTAMLDYRKKLVERLGGRNFWE